MASSSKDVKDDRKNLFQPAPTNLLQNFFSGITSDAPGSKQSSSTTVAKSQPAASSSSTSGTMLGEEARATSTQGRISPNLTTESAHDPTAKKRRSKREREAERDGMGLTSHAAGDLDSESDTDGDALDLTLKDIDITTTDDPDFGELAELIEKFQEDARFKDVLTKGLDMRQYAKDTEDELARCEREGINDLVEACEDIAELHEQLTDCDGILETMEQLLDKFRNDLSNINSEIKSLQDKSSSMSVRVKNRREIGTQVSQFIDQLYVSPELEKSITRAEVDEAYLAYVLALRNKLNFLKNDEQRGLPCCQESLLQVEKLRVKAAEKIRRFIAEEFRALRRGSSLEIAVVQKDRLLKYKNMMRFLGEHAPEDCTELSSQYTSILSDVLFNESKTYIEGLNKFYTPVGSRSALLGTLEGTFKSKMLAVFSFGQSYVVSLTASIFSSFFFTWS